MTAPVMQQAQSGTRIAMTAPVLQTKVGESWTVGFVMPASWTIDALPKPNNAKVQLRGVAPTRFAALRFSGLAREPDIAQHTARLNTFISMHDLKPAGAPTVARYDPPWTLWFMRRNEILVALEAEMA
jgi:hypothetical protein